MFVENKKYDSSDFEKIKDFMSFIDELIIKEDDYIIKEFSILKKERVVYTEILLAIKNIISAEPVIVFKTRGNYNLSCYSSNYLIHKNAFLSNEKEHIDSIRKIDGSNRFIDGIVGDYYIVSGMEESGVRLIELIDIYRDIFKPLRIVDNSLIIKLINEINTYKEPFYFKVDNEYGDLDLVILKPEDLNTVDDIKYNKYKYSTFCGEKIVLKYADNAVEEQFEKYKNKDMINSEKTRTSEEKQTPEYCGASPTDLIAGVALVLSCATLIIVGFNL